MGLLKIVKSEYLGLIIGLAFVRLMLRKLRWAFVC
jgi:hypothetical protein